MSNEKQEDTRGKQEDTGLIKRSSKKAAKKIGMESPQNFPTHTQYPPSRNLPTHTQYPPPQNLPIHTQYPPPQAPQLQVVSSETILNEIEFSESTTIAGPVLDKEAAKAIAKKLSRSSVKEVKLTKEFHKEVFKIFIEAMTPRWISHFTFLLGLFFPGRPITRRFFQLLFNHSVRTLTLDNVSISKNSIPECVFQDEDSLNLICNLITRNEALENCHLIPGESLDQDGLDKLYNALKYNFSMTGFNVLHISLSSDSAQRFVNLNERNKNLAKWVLRKTGDHLYLFFASMVVLAGVLTPAVIWLIKTFGWDKILAWVLETYKMARLKYAGLENNFDELTEKLKASYKKDDRVDKIPTLHDPIPMDKYIEQQLVFSDPLLQAAATKDPKKINRWILHSEPGYGKTTWLLHKVYRWLKGNPIDEMKNKAVFFITFSEITSYCDEEKKADRVPELSHFLAHQCLSYDDDKRYNVLLIDEMLKHPEKILFILDGYDEVLSKIHENKAGQVKIKSDYALINKLFQNGSLLVTSRNYAVSQLRTDIRRVVKGEEPLEMKLEGFNATIKETYVDTFCDSLQELMKKKVCQNKAAVEGLKNAINTDKFLIEITNTPLNLQLLCSSWIYWQDDKAQAVKSITISRFFYEAVFRQRMRYLEKKGVNIPVPLNRIAIEQDTQQVIDITKFIAYKADDTDLSNHDINLYLKDYLKNNPGINMSFMLDDLNRLGFVISKDASCQPNLAPCDYKFAHDNYRSFLKAWYITGDAQALNDYKEHIRSHLGDDRLRKETHRVYDQDLVGIKFVVGILTEMEEIEKIKSFLQLFMVAKEKDEIIDEHAAPLLLSALEEISWNKKVFNNFNIKKIKDKTFHFIKTSINPLFYNPKEKEKLMQDLEKNYMISAFKTCYTLRQELIEELQLYQLLTSRHSHNKEMAIRLLSILGERGEVFVNELMSNLGDESEDVRVCAKTALSNLKPEKEILESQLDSDNEKLRINVVSLLSTFSFIDDKLINNWIDKLKDETKAEIALHVLKLISKTHKADVERIINDRLPSFKENKVGLLLIRILVHTGYLSESKESNTAIDIFDHIFTTVALSSGDKISFVKDLAKLSPNNTETLLTHNNSQVHKLLYGSILNSDSSELKEEVIKILSIEKTDRVFDELVSLTGDDKALVRKRAFLELKNFTAAETDVSLMNLLEKQLVNEVDSDVRLVMMENLENVFKRGKVKGKLEDTLVVLLAKENNLEIKIKILDLLEEIPLTKGEAIKPILRQLQGINSKLLPKAVSILKKNFSSSEYANFYKQTLLETPDLMPPIKNGGFLTDATFCALSLLTKDNHSQAKEILIAFAKEEEGLKILLKLSDTRGLLSTLSAFNLVETQVIALLNDKFSKSEAQKLINNYQQNSKSVEEVFNKFLESKDKRLVDLASPVINYLRSTGSFFNKPTVDNLLQAIEPCIKSGACKKNGGGSESMNTGRKPLSVDDEVQTSASSKHTPFLISSTAVLSTLSRGYQHIYDFLISDTQSTREYEIPVNAIAVYPNQQSNASIKPENFKHPTLSTYEKLTAAQYAVFYARKLSPFTLPWNKLHPLSRSEQAKLIEFQKIIARYAEHIAAQHASRTGQSELFADKFSSMTKTLTVLSEVIQEALKNNKISDASMTEIQHQLDRVQEMIHGIAKQNKIMKRFSVKERRLSKRNQYTGKESIVETQFNIVSGKLSQKINSTSSMPDSPMFIADYESERFSEKQQFWAPEHRDNQSLLIDPLQGEIVPKLT